MRHARALSMTLLVFATSAGLSARAEPLPATDDAASARADELTHRGNDLALKRRWADAAALFQQAWALKHSYDIGGNLGLAELALGKHRDAAEHLSFALKTFPANGKTEHRQLLQESVAKAKLNVATLTIEIDAKGAVVLVDGKEVGRSPLADDVFVEPGAHTVEAKLAGYGYARQSVEAAKGSEQVVRLSLAKASTAGTASAAGSVAPSITLPPKDQPHAGMRKAIVIGGASASGVGLVMGVVFTVLANEKSNATREKAHAVIATAGPDACARPAAPCQEVADLFHARAAFTNAAGWSFVSAGALGAATAVYAIATRGRPKAALRAAPVVTAQGAGLLVGGVW